jgi:hypothetical protein
MHAWLAPQSVSASQATHSPSVVLQMGLPGTEVQSLELLQEV